MSSRLFGDVMLDALTAVEVQALRLRLHDFASQQSDRAVQIHCHALDLNLARIVAHQEDQVLRELARSVEQLDEAVRIARAGPARLSDTRPDRHAVTVEPDGPRPQWFAVDLQTLSPLV